MYCSEACRCRAAYERQKNGEAPSYERACVECGARFSTPIASLLICSDECKRARERTRERRRLRHNADYSLRARERCRAWSEEHRDVRRSNPWLSGPPPYAVHLPGVTSIVKIDPVPRWPIELRNTRGLHGALTAVLDIGHDAHVPYWSLRPWESGWAVHWLHPLGEEKFVCTSVACTVFDRPSTVTFHGAVRWRAPRVARRGHQLVRLTTITPVVVRTDGGAKVAERASETSIVSSLSTEFARRIAPSAMWLEWVRQRVRVSVVENDTHKASVPLGDKYGVITGWEGTVVLEVNAVARWLLQAAARVGMGSRVAFGFGCVALEGIEP